MAKIVEKYSTNIYITNDNPRNEDEGSIINDIVSGFSSKNYSIIKDRKEAINTALMNFDNSIIIIFGKGRENYQIIGDKKYYHSDINLLEEHII